MSTQIFCYWEVNRNFFGGWIFCWGNFLQRVFSKRRFFYGEVSFRDELSNGNHTRGDLTWILILFSFTCWDIWRILPREKFQRSWNCLGNIYVGGEIFYGGFPVGEFYTEETFLCNIRRGEFPRNIFQRGRNSDMIWKMINKLKEKQIFFQTKVGSKAFSRRNCPEEIFWGEFSAGMEFSGRGGILCKRNIPRRNFLRGRDFPWR